MLLLVRVDWQTWLVSPILAAHPPARVQEWRGLLQEAGFAVEEEGERFSTQYFLVTKGAASTAAF